jgi:hypothetical protein
VARVVANFFFEVVDFAFESAVFIVVFSGEQTARLLVAELFEFINAAILTNKIAFLQTHVATDARAALFDILRFFGKLSELALSLSLARGGKTRLNIEAQKLFENFVILIQGKPLAMHFAANYGDSLKQ